nr:MAG TPA: hypothetical protein [Caudoviricetes sp.]
MLFAVFAERTSPTKTTILNTSANIPIWALF